MSELETLLHTVSLQMKELQRNEAPTSLGFDDFAIMFALYQKLYLNKPLKAEDFSGYFKKHPMIPEDPRMEPPIS